MRGRLGESSRLVPQRSHEFVVQGLREQPIAVRRVGVLTKPVAKTSCDLLSLLNVSPTASCDLARYGVRGRSVANRARLVGVLVQLVDVVLKLRVG